MTTTTTTMTTTPRTNIQSQYWARLKNSFFDFDAKISMDRGFWREKGSARAQNMCLHFIRIQSRNMLKFESSLSVTLPFLNASTFVSQFTLTQTTETIVAIYFTIFISLSLPLPFDSTAYSTRLFVYLCHRIFAKCVYVAGSKQYCLWLFVCVWTRSLVQTVAVVAIDYYYYCCCCCLLSCVCPINYDSISS